MLNTVHKVIAVNFLLLYSLLLSGQGGVLDQYVELALAESPAILASRMTENERLLAVSLAEANQRVSVDVKSDYLLSAGGRRLAFPIGDLLNPTYAALNQLTGEEAFPTDLENVNERFIPSNFHDTRAEARYPLLQPLIGREAALRRARVVEASFATEVLENEIRRQVRELYYAWLQSQEGRRIIDSSRLVLRELLRVNRVLVANQKLTADAVYGTEAALAELDGSAAELRQQERLAQAALNRLLRRDMDTPLASMPLGEPPANPAPLTSLSTRARAQRPELKQLDAGTESLLRLEALQAAERKPSLGLFLNVGAQGFFSGDLRDHPYLTGGLAFNWKLYDGKKSSLKQQQTRVARERLAAQKEDVQRGIELQLWEATLRMENERAQLDAARKRERAARASAELVAARYRNQKALLLEYLDARNQVTTARLEANLARYRLHQAHAALLAALGE